MSGHLGVFLEVDGYVCLSVVWWNVLEEYCVSDAKHSTDLLIKHRRTKPTTSIVFIVLYLFTMYLNTFNSCIG